MESFRKKNIQRSRRKFLLLICTRFLHRCFFRSLNNFWNFPRCAKSHATMSTERANDRLVTVNYSARTFSCYRAKPKCNFISSSVRWIHNVKTIVADCVEFFLFFLEKKIKRNRAVKFAKMLIYAWDSAWTLISRSFPRLVDIVAWPVQRRFAYRGKFQKLFYDRGEIRSNLGYSTSFPRNQKQLCRNRVH